MLRSRGILGLTGSFWRTVFRNSSRQLYVWCVETLSFAPENRPSKSVAFAQWEFLFTALRWVFLLVSPWSDLRTQALPSCWLAAICMQWPEGRDEQRVGASASWHLPGDSSQPFAYCQEGRRASRGHSAECLSSRFHGQTGQQQFAGPLLAWFELVETQKRVLLTL